MQSTDPRPAAPTTDRLRGLDALRGFAALGVTVFHLTSQYARDFTFAVPPTFSFPYGFQCVTLFFIISGFVITMSLRRAGRPADFVVARFARLYPNYWAAVLLATATLSALPLPDTAPGHSLRIARAAANLTMFQRWLRVPSIDPVYWTLEVEICFYLMILALLVFRAVDRGAMLFVGLTCLAAADAALSPGGGPPALDKVKNALILPYIHVFLMGICLYKITREGRRAYWLAVPLCLAAALVRNGAIDAVFLGTFAAAVYLAVEWAPVALAWPLPQFLGTISYSLYLVHNTAGRVVLNRSLGLGVSTDVAVALAVAVSIGLAAAMTYGIERPALRLIRGAWRRDRPRPTAGAVEDATAPPCAPGPKSDAPGESLPTQLEVKSIAST